MCANKVVADVRCNTDLPDIRPQDTCQFTSAQEINQLEGLAVAIPWGFESPLPHHSIRLSARPRRAARLAHGEPTIRSNVLSKHSTSRRLGDGASKDPPKATASCDSKDDNGIVVEWRITCICSVAQTTVCM